MPVWMPPCGRTAGYQRRSASQAIAKGLTCRPLAVTAKDTLDWHKTRSPEEQAATLEGKINGLSMKREAEVLAARKKALAKRVSEVCGATGGVARIMLPPQTTRPSVAGPSARPSPP